MLTTERIRIVITVEGGVVSSVVAERRDIEAVIIDYDVDYHEDEAVTVLTPSGPEKAIVSHWQVSFDPVSLASAFEVAGVADESERR